MSKKLITVEAPSHPVIRYKFVSKRKVVLDMRGIRNPQRLFNGHLNPAVGSQKRFLSPEHLQCMVNEYFESCNGPLIDKFHQLVRDENKNVVKIQVKPWTVSGLALYLGISTMTLKKYREGAIDTLLDEMKAKTDDTMTFSDVVLRARQRIEGYAESRLYDKDGQRGGQFVLDCCFNWVGRKEASDIAASRAATKLRKDEFDLKKKLISEGDEEGNLTINIVRKSEE